MKNLYAVATEKIFSLQRSSSLSSWRSKGAGLLLGTMLVAGFGNSANAQISLGTGSTTTSTTPVATNYGYTYTQQLFLKSEINASGAITSISFTTNTATNWDNNKDWVVYLGHSSKSVFSSTSDWVPVSDLTQVFDGVVDYPATFPGTVTVTFTTPFVYNNVDNLVIAIDQNTPQFGAAVSWKATSYGPSTNYRSLYHRSDSVNANPATPPTGTRGIILSDITLGGIIQSCPAATNLTASIALDGTNLAWTAAVGTSSVGYGYEIRTSGAAGSGATGLVTSGTTGAGILTAAVTGLTANTNYQAYVRSLCAGTDTSSWTLATNFRTGYCIPSSVAATSYVNNFSTTGGTDSNISNLNSGFAPTGYQNNFETQSVTSFATSTIDFNYSIVGGSVGVGVWIDYNNDFVFDDSEKVYATTSFQASGDYNFSYSIPANAVPGEYRMRIKINYNAIAPDPCSSNDSRSEAEDYKFVLLAQSIVAPDSATVGTFTAGLTPAVVTSVQACQSVQVSATVTEPGLTDVAGADSTITGWIGKSATNTDPATWPESAWTLANYSEDLATGDVYTASFSGLTVGDVYFASRFRIGTGVYVFGGQSGLWDATTNTNATLVVNAIPEITATASTASICNLGTSTLTAASANTNYTYAWMPGALTGATADVTPSETTIYTVTGTDSVTGCTTTATVTVTVNPTPSAITIAEADLTVCEDTIVELNVSSSSALGDGQIGTDTTETTNTGITGFPNPFNAWYGGARNQMVYTKTELEAIGLEVGSSISSIGFEISDVNGTKTCNDFTIKIASTTLSSLTEFVTSSTLTTVYNQTFTPTAEGAVSFNFTAPFIWDGVSNIIVETTHNSGNSGNGSGTKVKFTSTGTTNTSFYATKDNVMPATAEAFNAATGYSTSSALARRPNTLFGFVSAAPVSWSPIEGLFTDAAATVAYVADANTLTVYAKPATTTTYTASASTAICSVTDSVVITVTPTPDAPTGVSPQAATTIADLEVAPSTSVWYASEADALAGQNPLSATTALTDGATYYAVSVSGECRSEVLAILIDFTLSNQSNQFASLKYYPNPVTENLNVSFSEDITAYSVFNMIGQQVLSAKVNATSTSVDMSSLPSGSYMVQIQTANASKVIKVIKK